jgi:hypothetical protein
VIDTKVYVFATSTQDYSKASEGYEVTVKAATVILENKTWGPFTAQTTKEDLLADGLALGSEVSGLNHGGGSVTYENTTYSIRIQFGGNGTSSNNRYISFDVLAPCTIQLIGKASSTGRSLTLGKAAGALSGDNFIAKTADFSTSGGSYFFILLPSYLNIVI